MRADFYVIADQQPQARHTLACRIVEKAYQNQHRIFINVDNEQQAQQLDELLWTYKDISFIPHNIRQSDLRPIPAIQIGYQTEPDASQDILINLATNIPNSHSQFQRIIEIVSPDSNIKQSSREHYRFYQQQGRDCHSHQL